MVYSKILLTFAAEISNNNFFKLPPTVETMAKGDMKNLTELMTDYHRTANNAEASTTDVNKAAQQVFKYLGFDKEHKEWGKKELRLFAGIDAACLSDDSERSTFGQWIDHMFELADTPTDKLEETCGYVDDLMFDGEIVDSCEYASQPLRSRRISNMSNIDPNKPLAREVYAIEMGYPFFNRKPGHECYTYDIQPCRTWGSLVSQIVKVFQQEYNAADDDSVYDISEYIIGRVDITANGGAFVVIEH